jgi:hypothetical protein
MRKKSTRGEGAARAQRDAELEADQEVHVAELVFLLVLLLLLHPLLLLPLSTRACLRLCALASPPLPPASRALPLARRPGPELELRFSHRRGGAQRSNCSQRHSYRLGDGAAAAAPPRPSSPASPASHIGGQGPGPSSSSASATGAAARREATAATGNLEAGGAGRGGAQGAARRRARRRGGAPKRGPLCGGGRACVIALAHINHNQIAAPSHSPRPRTRCALALTTLLTASL